MKLTDIPAPAYVNLRAPGAGGDGLVFYTNLKWDGVRLLKHVHDLTCTNHRWTTGIDASVEEICSDRWEVQVSGPIPLDHLGGPLVSKQSNP